MALKNTACSAVVQLFLCCPDFRTQGRGDTTDTVIDTSGRPVGQDCLGQLHSPPVNNRVMSKGKRTYFGE